jgi:hypothetical protein
MAPNGLASAAGKGLLLRVCVQEEPLGRPAAKEDISERPAVYVVARGTVKLGAQWGSPRGRAILDGLIADYRCRIANAAAAASSRFL